MSLYLNDNLCYFNFNANKTRNYYFSRGFDANFSVPLCRDMMSKGSVKVKIAESVRYR